MPSSGRPTASRHGVSRPDNDTVFENDTVFDNDTGFDAAPLDEAVLVDGGFVGGSVPAAES
jgi:hypothetical protein